VKSAAVALRFAAIQDPSQAILRGYAIISL